MTDQTWRDDAACRGTDPAAFFPEGSSNDVTYAKRVCGRCPINAMIGCAREAIAIESTEHRVVGVWAGTRVSQSSTSRLVALKELHAIAGIPYVEHCERRSAERIRPCSDCGREMRDRNVRLADKPGTVRHRSQGLCDTCHRSRFGDTSAGQSSGPAVRIRAKRRSRPEPCTGNCGRILRSSSTTVADFPGTLSDVGTWKCRPCYDRANQTVSGAA